MTQIARHTKEHFLDTVDPLALRKAIDLVATLRARVIRVGLFGTLLFRPDPSGSFTQDDRQRHDTNLRDEITMIVQVCAAIAKGRHMPDTSDDIAAWIQSVAIQSPKELAQVMQTADLSGAILVALEKDEAALGAAINAHMYHARHGFFDLITALCDALWDAINAHQAVALEKATAAAQTLGNRLTRLEHIGQHVRLVSLNASVEAAHAGNAGKGLMIIAQEFKALAEEIQTLAKDAHDDVCAIS